MSWKFCTSSLTRLRSLSQFRRCSQNNARFQQLLVNSSIGGSNYRNFCNPASKGEVRISYVFSSNISLNFAESSSNSSFLARAFLSNLLHKYFENKLKSVQIGNYFLCDSICADSSKDVKKPQILSTLFPQTSPVVDAEPEIHEKKKKEEEDEKKEQDKSWKRMKLG